MADSDPIHVYPTPDGGASTTSSGPCPAPAREPAAESKDAITLTPPAVPGGTDQPSI
jgi:hypothetical protein